MPSIYNEHPMQYLRKRNKAVYDVPKKPFPKEERGNQKGKPLPQEKPHILRRKLFSWKRSTTILKHPKSAQCGQ